MVLMGLANETGCAGQVLEVRRSLHIGLSAMTLNASLFSVHGICAVIYCNATSKFGVTLGASLIMIVVLDVTAIWRL